MDTVGCKLIVVPICYLLFGLDFLPIVPCVHIHAIDGRQSGTRQPACVATLAEVYHNSTCQLFISCHNERC